MGEVTNTSTIREARTDEFEEVAALTIEAYQEFGRVIDANAWEQMRNGLANVAARADNSRLLVVAEDGRLVGAVHYYPPGTSDVKYFPVEWASLRVLAVAPAYRGKGLGRLLTDECIRRARRDSAAMLGLHTSELMTVAIQMYERMGFRQERELPRNYGLRYWLYALDLTDASDTAVKYVLFEEEYVEDIVALSAAEGWTSLSRDRAEVLRALTAPGVVTVVAIDEGKVVGFAQAMSDGVIQAFLSLLIVDAGHRKQHIGRRLVEEAFRLCGGERMDLMAEDAAEGFYQTFVHQRIPGYRIYPNRKADQRTDQ